MGGLGLLSILQHDPIVFFLLAAALVEAIALHEFAHALAADVQGDRLPRALGRLTLNPARHLDPLGTLLIFLVGFGWGKPVEFRPDALASKRFGASLVALAGPMMNLVLALAGGVALSLTCTVVGVARCAAPTGLLDVFITFLEIFLGINVVLAVFNLIPLPPLDGSRLLTLFLPPSKQKIIFFLDRYGFILLIAVVLFGGTRLIGPLIDFVHGSILRIVGA